MYANTSQAYHGSSINYNDTLNGLKTLEHRYNCIVFEKPSLFVFLNHKTKRVNQNQYYTDTHTDISLCVLSLVAVYHVL